MDPFTYHAATNDRHFDDNLDARCARIRQRLLDGIETTLNELAQPDDVQRAPIADTVRGQCAPLVCRQATCRRARRCRRQPCQVSAAALRRSELRTSE